MILPKLCYLRLCRLDWIALICVVQACVEFDVRPLIGRSWLCKQSPNNNLTNPILW